MVALRKPFFVVPVFLSNLSASDSRAGFPPSNVARLDVMGLVWSCPGPSGGWIAGQMPANSSIDFLSMVNGGIYTNSVYRLRLGDSLEEVTGSSAKYDNLSTPYLDGGHTGQADGRYHSHLELPSPVSASWFRIDFGGMGGPFELGGIVLGKKLEPSRFYDKDFERGSEDLGSVELNRFAVPDYTPGAKLRTLSFTLSWLNEAEYELTFAPFFELLGTTSVVFCCFDPALSPYRQNRTYLGWLRNPPFARGGAKPRNMSMEFQIRSLI
ncbi:hypothetical protein HNO88_002940 [Novosphingobium chloroacetimidivorans]|uniref:Uncharacterized protein n=1 Tax=Novosphingobium chloroacetimidivorans TaxID=1428314 RepID=A0A7W7NWQ9_9SPHN|nr:hypothetical protein [Novosphingobium chloroacetimidivorans]MBB4859611.1 hypothetical protein [Novosphingobium chloroacetimidivorans]